MTDKRDIRHQQSTTRDTLATEVRSDIQTGAGTNVTIAFFTQTPNAQTGSGFLTINLGASPFGTAAITSQSFTYSGTATGTTTRTGTGTDTVQSFAIYDRATTPNKILRGSAGATTATHTYDIGIVGGAAISAGEKIKLTSFTYTASL
jgi:hypothetical protein